MGSFLGAFSDSYEKYGTEIDPEAVAYANENYDFDIRLERFGEDNFENDSFDLVIFRGMTRTWLTQKVLLIEHGKC